MKDVKISFMEKDELTASARALSAAMLTNPLHVAVFQGKGEKERLKIEEMFYNLFTRLPGIIFVAKAQNKIVGVMRMKSCQGSEIPKKDETSENMKDIAWRQSIWHAEWARHDPLNQHWHLGPIGVLPSHQGRGIGLAFMQRFCTEVDACHATAYLETDLDINVHFYEKFGFKIIDESKIFGVKNRYMLRDALS